LQKKLSLSNIACPKKSVKNHWGGSHGRVGADGGYTGDKKINNNFAAQRNVSNSRTENGGTFGGEPGPVPQNTKGKITGLLGRKEEAKCKMLPRDNKNPSKKRSGQRKKKVAQKNYT